MKPPKEPTIRIHGDCWLWGGRIGNHGYGFARGGKLSHRVIYEAVVGTIPEGLELDHLCRVTRCVNPDHLEPVTHTENIRRSPFFGRPTCAQGHRFDALNTFYNKSKHRVCRVCRRERLERFYAKHAGGQPAYEKSLRERRMSHGRSRNDDVGSGQGMAR